MHVPRKDFEIFFVRTQSNMHVPRNDLVYIERVLIEEKLRELQFSSLQSSQLTRTHVEVLFVLFGNEWLQREKLVSNSCI